MLHLLTPIAELSPEARRLRQFLFLDLLASLSGLAFTVFISLAYPRPVFWWSFGCTLIQALGLLVAIWLAGRNQVQHAVLVFVVDTWYILLVILIMIPQLLTGLLLLVIWPVTVAVPYMERRALTRLMVVSAGVGALACLLSLRPDPFGVGALIPLWLFPMLNVTIATVFVALTLLQLWQYSVRLNDILTETRTANLALQASERSLEAKVAVRTAELAQSEQHVRSIVDAALDAVITMDQAGMVTSWNPQATATFGWSSEEAVGQRLSTLIIPLNEVLLRARLETGLAKKRLRDQELDYLSQVDRLTAAATAIETDAFDPESLADVAARPDALGQLTRLFQRMAREFLRREQQLKQQVQELRIKWTKRAKPSRYTRSPALTISNNCAARLTIYVIYWMSHRSEGFPIP